MKYKNLFLQQSYLDSYDTYKSNLLSGTHESLLWDYVVLTASNEAQAEAYREQIAYRQKAKTLPSKTKFVVIPDRDGLRVGSGGATLGVLKYIYEQEQKFSGLKILVIHSGGDSKRVPQYSACGKLFSPVPHELPDGRRSTLFDEFIVSTSGMPSRMEDGMLVLSGDVLLLFNPLQIDFFGSEAAALSIKEDVHTGKNHGVFTRSASGNVGSFLHKQTVETLTSAGAVDKLQKVNIDTGAILLSSTILDKLYSIVDTEEKYNSLVNDTVRLSFYADFVYPMAENSTEELYYKEQPEGEFSDELLSARKKVWQLLGNTTMRLICMSPASFLHFGTSKELLKLVTENIDDYRFLNWESKVCTNRLSGNFAAYNSYIHKNAKIGNCCYLENSEIMDGAVIGSGSIISGATIENLTVPENVILHVLKLKNGNFVARMLGINDNPKENIWLGKTLKEPLWTAKLFSEQDTAVKAVEATLAGIGGEHSLYTSFCFANVTDILPWCDKLHDKIEADRFLNEIDNHTPLNDMVSFSITPRVSRILERTAKNSDFSKKIRIYYYLSRLNNDKELLNLCFKEIANFVLSNHKGTDYCNNLKISKDEVLVELPVRVNFGGGWTDTPPVYFEIGAAVLNAAVSLNGELPVKVTIKKLKEHKFALSSTDCGSYKEFTDIKALQDCYNPADAFALHKAALICAGIIPTDENIPLDEICKNLGGGIYLNTEVVNIPKGSGLGTSSILAAACQKALFEFLNKPYTEKDLVNSVLRMEQFMSTGGGWQDQIGGLLKGVKLTEIDAGDNQELSIKEIDIPKAALDELHERFCLIYTGQRRLARNLLREVLGKYISSEPEALDALYDIKNLAELMKLELVRGNIDAFARLLTKHWECSKRLDSGCTNTCINQIFATIDDLIDGKMICGAGGGGFLQIILKKGVTKQDLRTRLFDVFADSGVEVYDCEIF